MTFAGPDLSGSVAERLGHGDVTHTGGTGGLPVVQRLRSLGSPVQKTNIRDI